MGIPVLAELRFGDASLIDATTGKVSPSLIPIGSYSTTIIGDGKTTTFFIGHNLESMELIPAIYNQDGNVVEVTVSCTSLNNVVVEFGVAPEVTSRFKIVLTK